MLKGLAGGGGGGGGGRIFVDATGTSVPMPPAVRSFVATDHLVGALLLELGAPLAGCAGALDGVETVGAPRAPDPNAVAALRPDVIVAGTVDGVHDLVEPRLVEALRRIAPVVAVDLARAAVPDLLALLGARDRPRPTAPLEPGPTVPAPTYRS